MKNAVQFISILNSSDLGLLIDCSAPLHEQADRRFMLAHLVSLLKRLCDSNGAEMCGKVPRINKLVHDVCTHSESHTYELR